MQGVAATWETNRPSALPSATADKVSGFVKYDRPSGPSAYRAPAERIKDWGEVHEHVTLKPAAPDAVAKEHTDLLHTQVRPLAHLHVHAGRDVQ